MTRSVDYLVVGAGASGLAFARDTIRLQQVRHNSPTFNAALIAFVEAHRDDDAEKNRLTPPNPYPSTPCDMATMLVRTWASSRVWQGEPDVQRWIDASRLNLMRVLGERMGDPQVRAAVQRFVAHVPEASRRLPTLR